MLQNHKASPFKFFQRFPTWTSRFKLITMVYKAINDLIP